MSNIFSINKTDSPITVSSWDVYYVNKTNVEIVIVYDSSNVAYNAFKYTLNGTDYYYVLDDTQTDWTDDLGSIGYSLLPSEIDIDTNWGDAVTIPDGYAVQSVRSTNAYVQGNNPRTSTGSQLYFEVYGCNVYCNDTDVTLLGWKHAPLIQLFQITIIESQGSYRGYYLTCRPSQDPSYTPTYDSNMKLNDSSGDFFIKFVSYSGWTNNSSFIIYAMGTNGYALLLRRYDENDVLIDYYFSVPTTLWQFQNGVFTWLGNQNNNKDLAYYYKGNGTTAVRIHCIRA